MKRIFFPCLAYLLLFSTLFLSACDARKSSSLQHPQASIKSLASDTTLTTSVFAAGCFWCVEAVFESVEGVKEAVSGYTGGRLMDAEYGKVSAGLTDHAEAVEVYYDPSVVSYETLLEVFFGSQDPTTLNRQGPDSGRQYRSAIFYKDEREKTLAEAYIKMLEAEKVYDAPITTILEPLKKFYPAEDYHQNYERLHPDEPYVRRVSVPRLKRFQKKYPHLLKKK